MRFLRYSIFSLLLATVFSPSLWAQLSLGANPQPATTDTGEKTYTEQDILYNSNGALLRLKRYGSDISTPQDDYSYTYSGPLLTGVSGKDDGSNINASFSHDSNGNTTADGRANLSFAYNILNLPETVTSGNTQMATYHWLSDGTKYKVTDPAGNGVIYAGDLTYTVAVSGGNTTYALESTLVETIKKCF